MFSHPLARHIGVITLVKVIALALIYFACFAASDRPPLNGQSVAAALLGPTPESRR
ncbi:MAG TPA: hypothetical protein VMU42_05110 [Candidatus Sulfotelmatobacter sp.]|nr:hypothetical protein [Candidatus Sulfotelmatobacter sp.]